MGRSFQIGASTMVSGISAESRAPVFIIAPTGKSGTNFLAKVLITLGLCERSRKEVLTREDFLLFHSDLIKQYVEKTTNIWKRWEKDEGRLKQRTDEMLKSIGDGIVQFLGSPTEPRRRIVLKTPDSLHLSNIVDLFPDVKLILLFRDGRDTTESQLQAGYYQDYESAFANWSRKARYVLNFMDRRGANSKESSWIAVRFEDLATDPGSTARSVARFLGADAAAVDSEKIERLPVLGSSELGQEAGSTFQWSVHEKPKDFNPVGRWKSWNSANQELFKTIAGKELIDLGYESDLSW